MRATRAARLQAHGGAASLFCEEVSRRRVHHGELVGSTLAKVRAAVLDHKHPNKHT